MSGKIKSQLRALGHELQPVVQVGKTGLSPGVRQELEQALHAHELIKVRLLRECPIERKAAGKELALTGAAHIQTLGSVVLLYRARPEKPSIVFSGNEVTQTKRSGAVAPKVPGGATVAAARNVPGHAAARSATTRSAGTRGRQESVTGRSSPSGYKARRHSS